MSIQFYGMAAGMVPAEGAFLFGNSRANDIKLPLTQVGVIVGDEGNDTITGSAHDDLLIGGLVRSPALGDDPKDPDNPVKIDLAENLQTDLISIDPPHPSVFADVIRGRAGDDLIIGGSWDDENDDGEVSFLELLNGDFVDAGSVVGLNNIAWGGLGNDTMYGANGHDTLGGGDGDDLIYGFDGPDKIYGGRGDDTIRGGDGDPDYFHRESGGSFTIVEELYGGAGNDWIEGGVGVDQIYGGEGDDTLFGHIYVAPEDDLLIDDVDEGYFLTPSEEDSGFTLSVVFQTIDGGDGDDVIHGSAVNEKIYGGAGDDTIYSGGSEATVVELDGGRSFIYVESIDGGDGNDLIRAFGDGIQHIDGGAGDDTIYGGGGGETIFLHPDFDFRSEAERLNGGDGDDLIFGEEGRDYIDGGTGDDTLSGGEGEDVFIFQENGGLDIVTDFEADEDALWIYTAESAEEASGILKNASETTIDGQSGLMIDVGGGDGFFLVGLGIEDLASLDVFWVNGDSITG